MKIHKLLHQGWFISISQAQTHLTSLLFWKISRDKNASAQELTLWPRAWRSGHSATNSMVVAAGGEFANSCVTCEIDRETVVAEPCLAWGGGSGRDGRDALHGVKAAARESADAMMIASTCRCRGGRRGQEVVNGGERPISDRNGVCQWCRVNWGLGGELRHGHNGDNLVGCVS